MRKSVLGAALLLAVCTNSFSINTGSNFIDYEYPSHGFVPPVEPQEPVVRDRFSLQKYGEEVTLYQEAMEEYRAQIENYIENAKNDIEIITGKMDEATEDFNNAVENANTWLKEDHESRYGSDEEDSP